MVSPAEVSHVSELVMSSQVDSTQLPWVDVAEQRLSDPSLRQLRTRRGISALFPAYNDEGTTGVMVDYAVRTLQTVTSCRATSWDGRTVCIGWWRGSCMATSPASCSA